MLRNVFLKTIRDRFRSLLFWEIGLVALGVLLILFYPSIGGSAAIEQYMEALPKDLLALFAGDIVDFTSPEGFLNGELFFMMVPLLFLVFAIGFGSSVIAGEEEQGTLDLLLSNPLPRWRAVVEKFGALSVCVLLLALIFWLGLVISTTAIGMDISISRLAAACFSVTLLGVTFGTLALAIGCARGSRGQSIGVTSALGVGLYFLNAMANAVDFIEPFRKLSPFYYYIGADPLTNGLDLRHAAILSGLIVVLLAVALIAFERRDIAV